jgi:RNA polymerase sigma factor (sigma-70 family)
LAGLFDGLESLETRHADVDFETVRAGLDRDPGRAWRTLVEKYSRFVYSIAFRASSGLTDPEEFAAEIYRRVFVRLEASDYALIRGFQGKCDFRSYLFRMVKTERFRLFRRKGVERRAAETLAHDAAAEPSTDAAPEWPAHLGRAAAAASLEALSEDDRRLLVLRFAGGLKLRELADVTDARDTNDAAYRLRKALDKCDALRRARASPDWDEGAFVQALGAFRQSLFADDDQRIQNPTGEVSDSIENRQGDRS